MRKTLSILAFFFCLMSIAQNTPPFINYQAVIRDASGMPISPGATFTLNFKIYSNATTLTPVYEEEHSVTVPNDQIISLRIGAGNGISPLNNFSVIPWNLGQVHYLVSKDGNSIGSKVPFASVPYAFSSGGGSSNTYSPSVNINIIGNVLDLTNKLTQSVSVGSNQLPNSKIPVFTADQKGRLTSVGEYPANMGGDIIGKLDSQYVAKLRGAPLSTVMPVNGQVLQFNGSAWAPASGGNSSVTINQSGIVNVSPSGTPSNFFTISALAPIFGTSGIGTVVPGAYPNYNLNIPNPIINYNGTTGILSFSQNPFTTNLNISPSLSLTGNSLTVGSSTVVIPSANTWSKPTATAVALFNGSDNVGIGTTTPQQKLDVQGYIRVGAGNLPTDEAWLLYSPSPGLSILRAGGRATSEMRLDQNNNSPMTFWTNSAERIRIIPNGNVGIATAVPAAKLDVNGDFKLGITGNVLTKVIGGQASALLGTINPSTNLPTNITAPGAAVGDRVVVTLSGGTSTTVVLVSATISVANQININLYNFGATAAPGGTYTINYFIYR